MPAKRSADAGIWASEGRFTTIRNGRVRTPPGKLRPLNLYGKSKNDPDRWVLRQVAEGLAALPCWAGLKLFNACGPREGHKGPMASGVWHAVRQALETQALETGEVRLFKSNDPACCPGPASVVALAPHGANHTPLSTAACSAILTRPFRIERSLASCSSAAKTAPRKVTDQLRAAGARLETDRGTHRNPF